MTDETRWWLACPGETPEGPFTLAEIRERTTTRPGDWQVCADGTETWQPWATVDPDGPGNAGSPPTSPPNWSFTPSPSGVSHGVGTAYLGIMHLCLLVGPMGWIAALVMWQTKKNDDQHVDAHGRELANWICWVLIGYGICVILSWVFIGILLAIPLAIASLVCPIIGGIRAFDGTLWRYPVPGRIVAAVPQPLN